MVSISISISLSRQDASPSYPESMHHGSISSHNTPYLNRSTGTSLERLIPPKNRETRLVNISERDRRRVRMAASHENGVQIERKMSYGIGGAGNIRMFCLEVV
jgi:hypothetical protein